jgi:tryptophan 2,3-dioxygenase
LHSKGHALPKDVLERSVSEPYEPSEGVEDVFLKIYQNHERYYEEYVCLEALCDFDEQFLLWRQRHVVMVERMIGARMGTGGSSGVQYLSRTLSKRFFPELWSVRSRLGVSYG